MGLQKKELTFYINPKFIKDDILGGYHQPKKDAVLTFKDSRYKLKKSPSSNFLTPTISITTNPDYEAYELAILVHELAHSAFESFLKRFSPRFAQIFPKDILRTTKRGIAIETQIEDYLHERFAWEFEFVFSKIFPESIERIDHRFSVIKRGERGYYQTHFTLYNYLKLIGQRVAEVHEYTHPFIEKLYSRSLMEIFYPEN